MAITKNINAIHRKLSGRSAERCVVIGLCMILLMPWCPVRAQEPVERKAISRPRQDAVQTPPVSTLSNDSIEAAEVEVALRLPQDSTVVESEEYVLKHKIEFNPSPTRAVWLSALCPGLGQIYNRRYWKLPIVVGGFMGLGYATSWNNNQYQDYIQGYQDLTDNDPNTNSYMNFFPPTVNESDLDKNWLTRTFKSRRDFYRRNRDLCIICLAALYLVCMLDAYVDASMAHFDISPHLSMDVQPAVLKEPTTIKPALGMSWAFNF